MAQPPLRILYVMSSSEIGGAEQIVLNLMRHCDPARVVMEGLSLMGTGPWARLASQAGAPSTNWALRHVGNPYLLRRMQLFLRRGQYDVVQTSGLRSDVLVRWVAHGAGVPVVSTIHSPDPWRRLWHVWLDRMTLDGVTAFVGNSHAAMRSRIERERYPAGRMVYIPTGIPDRPPADDRARRKARVRFRIGEGEGPVLAVVANVREAKGYPDLFDTLVRLKEKWPRIVCICAGRDEMGGLMERRAEAMGLTEQVRFTGFLSDAWSIYDAAYLAVQASRWEGLPTSVIEAMRAGLPIVATDVGGTSELIEHERQGLLTPARDAVALADAIDRVLSDEAARKRWGEAARERYEAEYRIERMVERYTELYERLCGRM